MIEELIGKTWPAGRHAHFMPRLAARAAPVEASEVALLMRLWRQYASSLLALDYLPAWAYTRLLDFPSRVLSFLWVLTCSGLAEHICRYILGHCS